MLSKKIDDFRNNLPKLIYNKSKLVRKTAKVIFEKIGEYLIEKDLGRLIGEKFLFEEDKLTCLFLILRILILSSPSKTAIITEPFIDFRLRSTRTRSSG